MEILMIITSATNFCRIPKELKPYNDAEKPEQVPEIES